MTVIAGVDEAGRGSVLGPLLVAGVSIEERDIPKLVKLGVKDSKLLSPARRRKLYREIRGLAKRIVWQKIEPTKIDAVVFKGVRLFRLNYLEAQYMASVLSKLEFERAYVDCCDTLESRFGDLVADLTFERRRAMRGSAIHLGEENPFRERILSRHHADSTYVVVSAASIVAKVRRDACIVALQKKHATTLGSGYPSDPDTTAFLEALVRSREEMPTFIRSSWATVRKLRSIAGEESTMISDLATELPQSTPGL